MDGPRESVTQEGATPPDFWQQIDRRIEQKIANATRAASIRNASISSGGTLSIEGGSLVLKDDDGTVLHYIGPVQPDRADGTPQQGWAVNRSDGTVVLELFDANPIDSGGKLNQALNWFDRTGNIVLADDTNVGVGLARPYIPIPLYPAALNASTATSSTTFTDTLIGIGYKQHPMLYVQVGAANDTAGATGQVQVLVNGAVWGAPQSTSSAAVTRSWGPIAVPGNGWDGVTIEVQARMASGTGNVLVVPRACIGMQSF